MQKSSAALTFLPIVIEDLTSPNFWQSPQWVFGVVQLMASAARGEKMGYKKSGRNTTRMLVIDKQ